jgi:hypothetical protein
VSIDWASPAGSWRWGGPKWTGQVPDFGAGGIVGLTVGSDRPAALAKRWGDVLGSQPAPIDGGAVIEFDGGRVCFVPPQDDTGEGICAVEIAIRGAKAREAVVCGVRLVVRPTA